MSRGELRKYFKSKAKFVLKSNTQFIPVQVVSILLPMIIIAALVALQVLTGSSLMALLVLPVVWLLFMPLLLSSFLFYVRNTEDYPEWKVILEPIKENGFQFVLKFVVVALLLTFRVLLVVLASVLIIFVTLLLTKIKIIGFLFFIAVFAEYIAMIVVLYKMMLDYAMVGAVLLEDTNAKATEILRESKSLMTGNKIEFLLMSLSFVPWGILMGVVSVIPVLGPILAFLGYVLLLFPYVQQTTAFYYSYYRYGEEVID